MRRCSGPILTILMISSLVGCAPAFEGADQDICNQYSIWLSADTADPAERARLLSALDPLVPDATEPLIVDETRALIAIPDAGETEFRTQGQRLVETCTELGWEPIVG